MLKIAPIRKNPAIYLVPILMGMGGILFAQQVQDTIVRMLLVLFCVAVPLFIGGNFLGQRSTGRTERFFLLAGIAMLMLGAAATLSDFSGGLIRENLVSEGMGEASRWVGSLSLLLGLFVVLFMLARTGEAIEEIGDRFSNLADHISEGFILTSRTGRILLVNRRLLEMSGLRESDILGRNSLEVVRALNADIIEEHIDLRTKGIASEYEIAWKVNGEERRFWFSGSPVYDHAGRIAGAIATVRDITEQYRLSKRVERYAQSLQQLVDEQTQRLRQSEEQFRDLLLHMNEGFLTIDEGYHVCFVNNRFCDMLKTAPEALVGREVFTLVTPAGRVRLLNLLRAAEQGNSPEQRPEFNLICKDGSLVPVVIAVALVGKDTAGGEPRHSLVVTDVSELKRMHAQLEERANELEAANREMRKHDRAKDSFLSNVSHELRTPLSTIAGYVEMLESGSLGPIESAQRNAIQVMARNAQRLMGHINELIDFSRMQIRGIQLNSSLFAPDKLAQETLDSFQPQIIAKPLTALLETDGEIRPAWGDRQRITQALAILLSNAIKFTRAGGSVRLRVAQNGRNISFSVTDSGVGIDYANQDRVFDKFFQVDSSMTRRFEGAGIGLSIAKSIVEAHGGRIELESALNQGSTFTLTFPNAAFDDTFDVDECKPLHGASVLLGDESDIFCDKLTEVLGACECETRVVRTGFGFVRESEEVQPDIMILNDTFTDVGTLTILSNLRENPATGDIPILVITSGPNSEARRGASILRGVNFLDKPFSARALVAELLRIHGGEGEFGRVSTARLASSETAPRAVSGVFLIGLDSDLAEWMETALRRRRVTCYSASTFEQARELAANILPDVILVDMDVSEANAIKFVQLFHEFPATRHTHIHLLGNGGTVGFDAAKIQGILNKPFSAEEVYRIVKLAQTRRIMPA